MSQEKNVNMYIVDVVSDLDWNIGRRTSTVVRVDVEYVWKTAFAFGSPVKLDFFHEGESNTEIGFRVYAVSAEEAKDLVQNWLDENYPDR